MRSAARPGRFDGLVAHRHALGASSLAVALLAAAPARADSPPDPVRLAWVRGHGAEGCPVADRIAEEVTARLGRSPFTQSPSARTIDVLVTRTEGGYRAEIDVRASDGAAEGTRELTSDASGCGALEAATVLALALAIDPLAGLAPPKPAEAPKPAAPDTFTPPPQLFAAAAAPPPMALAPRVEATPPALGATSFALRGGLGLGLLPRAAGGVGVAVAAGLGDRFALTAEAAFLPEARAADSRFGFGLTAVGLGACGRVLGRDPLDAALCAAVWGGALHAVVYELAPVTPGDFAWGALEAGPRLRLRLASRVHAELGAHVFVPFVRRGFVVEGHTDAVFRGAAVAAEPYLGLGASFL